MFHPNHILQQCAPCRCVQRAYATAHQALGPGLASQTALGPVLGAPARVDFVELGRAVPAGDRHALGGVAYRDLVAQDLVAVHVAEPLPAHLAVVVKGQLA